jgi:2-hydroxy-3-keto-5-methylthiopentenyl-1-phosphate phosphatase
MAKRLFSSNSGLGSNTVMIEVTLAPPMVSIPATQAWQALEHSAKSPSKAKWLEAAGELSQEKRSVAVFCDFDGTISEHDAIVMVMERFAPPEWRGIVAAMLKEKTLTLAKGVPQLFALLPSALRPEIETFVREEVKLREGFENFLAFCKQEDIPVFVVSGGIDFLIQPVLAPFMEQITLITNEACFDGEFIGMKLPYYKPSCSLCGDCACCKIQVLDAFDAKHWAKITIGDSLSDLGMSQVADCAFARGSLLQDLTDRSKPCLSYHTFDDILNQLKERLVL